MEIRLLGAKKLLRVSFGDKKPCWQMLRQCW